MSSKLTYVKEVKLNELSQCFARLITVGGPHFPRHFRTIRNGGLRVFSSFVRFHLKTIDINSEKCIEYGK